MILFLLFPIRGHRVLVGLLVSSCSKPKLYCLSRWRPCLSFLELLRFAIRTRACETYRSEGINKTLENVFDDEAIWQASDTPPFRRAEDLYDAALERASLIDIEVFGR